MNLVEANIGSDVLKTIGTEIAEQAHFPFAIFGFAHSDEIDPAVVVVVEGGDAVSADPICLRQFDKVEALAMVVAP